MARTKKVAQKPLGKCVTDVVTSTTFGHLLEFLITEQMQGNVVLSVLCNVESRKCLCHDVYICTPIDHK